MEIVPVLDLLNGHAVHAVAGERANYGPVDSRLGHGADPIHLAARMCTTVGSRSLYVADLGAIMSGRRHDELIETLIDNSEGIVRRLYWDAGLRIPSDRERLPTHPNFVPIWGSETVNPVELASDPSLGPSAFSVDLSGGVILGDWRAWGASDDRDAVGLAAIGARLTNCETLIVLDLKRVGVPVGPVDVDLLRAIRATVPAGVRLGVGGGVRPNDLARLEMAGVDLVLLATAIHDGSLTASRHITTGG